ncbi:hypothetical protein Cgig2_027705 [Carnegiea gigantea]|uniref:Myb-like domain-containing protein n=1 Tax=Carnegiea gigantea TaxID=171969 RepID=A0A9Q1Q6I4_9CARY|nr:hypothetical protein Cgig2_027705 [Carnegiea gigantea]
MAASANQHQEQSAFNGASTSNPSNGNSGTRQDNSATASAMKHNPGIDTDWTAEEQAILDDGLVKYASDSSVVRYAKIALQLPNKTVRDVALRSRWMNVSPWTSLPEEEFGFFSFLNLNLRLLNQMATDQAEVFYMILRKKRSQRVFGEGNKISIGEKKEISKRRKEDHSRKSKDKKEKVNDSSSKSSQLASRPGAHPYSAPVVCLDNDDGISYKAIGGPTGELLEQNARFFEQITANFSSFQIQENINLFCQVRENLTKIMNR